MTIQTQLTQKDFVNACLTILYEKTAVKIITGIAIVFGLINIVLIFVPPYQSPVSMVAAVVMAGIFPVATFFTAKNNFNGNGRNGEVITYMFMEDYYTVTGETFNANLSWSKVPKVTQTQKWLFIWQNKNMANAIPKRDIHPGSIAPLKPILTKHKVKNNL